jgi:ribosomal protein RSM22 (predicted rRNA methylase)
MNLELPRALREALAGELDGVSRNDLAQRAARTSRAYRSGGGSAGVIREPADALAYALVRLPATYAACASVLAEARRMAPAFRPARLLDAGCGPGAASWAAVETWPEIAHATWLDASAPFLGLAGRLGRHGAPPLRSAEVVAADLAAHRAWPEADLVMATYALAELAPEARAAAVPALWMACRGMLVLVEPGTPAGFERILAARQSLIAKGADVLAPCPHAGSCPLESPDWCHFSVRLPRSRDHRLVKAADAPFEDEKFAYLIAARPGLAPAQRRPRILAHPRVGKGGAVFKLCGPDGQEARTVARRDKAAFARARRLGWGDLFE